MRFKIDNKYINREFIGVPTMNYGQLWRYEKFEKVNYEIQIKREVFFEKLSDWFKEFQVDAIEESGIMIKGEFPVYDEYEKAGFPGLKEMLNQRPQLLSEIILFHDLDILNSLLKHEIPGTGILNLINSLDQVLINEYIIFKGIAFRVR